MTTAKLTCCHAVVVTLFVVQLWHTVMDRNDWPFCSYNMFNVVIPDQSSVMKVVLIDSNCRVQRVDPGRVLPIEFFKATAILEEVFTAADTKYKAKFASIILDRLNSQPWPTFDETLSAAHPTVGGKFISFELDEYSQELSTYSSTGYIGERKVRSIFSYRIGAVVRCRVDDTQIL